MKINCKSIPIIFFAITLIGCSGEPGPYDGSWSYNSDKTNELEDAGFMRKIIDQAANMRYENLKIKNNMYTLNFMDVAKANCKIIVDSSVGNCELSNGNGDEGATFSLVDGNLHVNDGFTTYVLDKN